MVIEAGLGASAGERVPTRFDILNEPMENCGSWDRVGLKAKSGLRNKARSGVLEGKSVTVARVNLSLRGQAGTARQLFQCFQ